MGTKNMISKNAHFKIKNSTDNFLMGQASKLTIYKIQKFLIKKHKKKRKTKNQLYMKKKRKKNRAANWAVFAITSETVMIYNAHGKIKW